MLSGTLLAVLGTLAGSIVGASITGLVRYRTTKLNQQSRDRRQRTEYYIDKKVEYLINLHEALSTTDSLIRGLYGMPNDFEWKSYEDSLKEKEIEKIAEDLEIASRRASIFLSEEDFEVIAGACTFAQIFITNDDFFEPSQEEVDNELKQEYIKYMDESEVVLRRILNDLQKESE